MTGKDKIIYADDDVEPVKTLIKLRAPSLIIGLFLGIVISFVTSGFEEVLSKNVQVAFFLPFIIYIADAVGTQTESIYSRDLKSGKANFMNYLKKEFVLGSFFGITFGLFSGAVVLFWLKNDLLALSVGIASYIAITVAPIFALIITQIFQSIKKDPAVGSGPIATVIQDMISILIYGIVCSMIIL